MPEDKDWIVVVETDDLIRELLERWLGEAGYATVDAGQPAPPRPPGGPVLVIADLSSPRTAQALLDGLKADYAAPILALSARFRRGLGASADAARELGVQKLLPKPFTREELLCAVNEATAPGRGP